MTFSEQMKRVFGWETQSTRDGIIGIVRITEHGPTVCAMGAVVHHFFKNFQTTTSLKMDH